MCKLNREGGVTRYATAIYIISQRIINFNVELKIYFFNVLQLSPLFAKRAPRPLAKVKLWTASMRTWKVYGRTSILWNLDTFVINGQLTVESGTKPCWSYANYRHLASDHLHQTQYRRQITLERIDNCQINFLHNFNSPCPHLACFSSLNGV